MDCQKVYQRIKAIRTLKGWTQEQAAGELEMSVSSYAKIERGETDVNLSRLLEIAESMDIDLSQLFEMNNVFNILGNASQQKCTIQIGRLHNILITEAECAHELEKSLLVQHAQEKEIENLKKQVTQLEAFFALLKQQN